MVLRLFSSNNNSKADELESILQALDKSQAVIEFSPDGIILTANPNFLDTLGYALSDIKGQHHSMFVDPNYKDSQTYKDFWASLARGEYQAAQYRRLGKDGREIWIEASYNPVFNKNGKVIKVIKFATDITPQKKQNSDYEGQLAALNKAQAVIEFELDGTIRSANENFLNTLGYSAEEVKGKHHSMFVESSFRNSPEYKDFWAKLNRGEYQAAQFKRVDKHGNDVWIEATYNPILDPNGKPYKVVKFAVDITPKVQVQQSLKKLMGQIEGAVDVVGKQSTNASSGSTQTTTNVQTVASGAEELHASVQEIAQNMSRSKVEADDAYLKVISAVEETNKLENVAEAMSGIVGLIQDIANQVNLLSLNATIEAARAGEAGKGFAVVAGEVKSLAGQASEATERISNEITNVQSVVKEVVSRLNIIRGSIDNVRNYVANVANAVEEQSSVAQEMSASMHSASQAVSNVTSNISEIVSATQTVHSAVQEARKAADSLVK